MLNALDVTGNINSTNNSSNSNENNNTNGNGNMLNEKLSNREWKTRSLVTSPTTSHINAMNHNKASNNVLLSQFVNNDDNSGKNSTGLSDIAKQNVNTGAAPGVVNGIDGDGDARGDARGSNGSGQRQNTRVNDYCSPNGNANGNRNNNNNNNNNSNNNNGMNGHEDIAPVAYHCG